MTITLWVLVSAVLFFVMYLIALLVEYAQLRKEKQEKRQLQERKFQIVQDIIWMCQEQAERFRNYGPYTVYFPVDDHWILNEPYCPELGEKTVQNRIFELVGVERITIGNVYQMSVGGIYP